MSALADDLLNKSEKTAPAEPPSSHSIYDARSRHVPLDTPQSLFGQGGPIQRQDLIGRAFALHGLLLPSEAASYCSNAARVGFAASDVAAEFPRDLRNNARLVHFSDALADALYRRLAPALCHRDIFMLQPMGFGAEGRWKPTGVNPCFRISRYQPGEHFAQHCDGMYANNDGECSIYTLVLYLNDDYEGGELEFSNSSVCFKPSVGTAVLFPHDMPHSALAVRQGSKYIARSELMFRCVDRERPPKEARFSKDPLFQRMAALYEHVGDLVKLGDVDATTQAYQEALGIQIAHHGTEAKERSERSRGRSVLEEKTWETILSFLSPKEVCGATISVSMKWQEISCSGLLWHNWFKQRWPESNEVLKGEAYSLDAELNDWMGLYRREHLLSHSPSVAVIFPAACVSAHDGVLHPLVPAVCRHHETGIGWDRSLKQRQGWTVGKVSYMFGTVSKSWTENGEVDFAVLPELFAWSFQHFELRPAEQHLVVPTLPGLMAGSKSVQERLATILHRRFQVQRLSFASAPLCALAARELRTGTVIWGCAFGTCSVFCFYEEELVGNYGTWDFEKATVEQVVEHVVTAQKQLNGTIASQVLQHVVISCEPGISIKKDNNRYGPTTVEVDADLRGWADAEELKDQLTSALGHDLTVHGTQGGAVCLGARTLAPRLPVERPLSLPESWEWRAFAQGQWRRLPAYMSAVFEGALRNDHPSACVQMTGRLGFYLAANLEDFKVAVMEPLNWRGMTDAEGHKLDDMQLLGSWCPLTRFLRGRPSSEPDRRKPEEVETKDLEEVQEVEDSDALHVRTLAGKLVFSQKRSPHLHYLDLLTECAKQMQTSYRRLQLLNGTTRIQCNEELQEAMKDDVVDLAVLVGPEPPAPKEFVEHEQIPEDLPGEMGRVCDLQRALLASFRKNNP